VRRVADSRRLRNRWRSVGFRLGSVATATAGLAPFCLHQIDQLNPVVRPDALAQIIEQFDHGESLVWRPVGGEGPTV
jgi:hypothetical protein